MSPRNQGRKLTKAVNIRAREIEHEALELRKAGATYRMTGQRLGVSKQRAHARVKAALAELREKVSEQAEEVRTLELERLDTMILGLWGRARQGDGPAIDRVVKIMQRRAELLGLDAPTRQELTGKDGKLLQIESFTLRVVGADGKPVG